MNGIDGAGMAGEVLAWIGLIAGAPLLLFGLLMRSADAVFVPVEIVVVQQPRMVLARWFAAGDFHERSLHRAERGRLFGREDCVAYVSRRNPSRMRLEARRPLTRVCLALGGAIAGAGLCGFALSLLPMILG